MTMAKGVDPRYNATHVVAAQRKGELGLHQIWGAYGARYIMIMQQTIRDPDLAITKAT